MARDELFNLRALLAEIFAKVEEMLQFKQAGDYIQFAIESVFFGERPFARLDNELVHRKGVSKASFD